MEKNSTSDKKIVAVLLSAPTERPYFYIVPDEKQIILGSIVRVPLGSRQVVGIVTDITTTTKDFSAKKLRQISEVFDYPAIQLELMKFIHFVSSYTLSPIGLIVRMVLRVSTTFTPEEMLKGIRFSGRMPERITPQRMRVLELSRNGIVWSRTALARAANVSISVVDGLKAKGVFERAELPPASIVPLPDITCKSVILENHQRKAANVLQDAVLKNRFSVCLLDGVTGSGKTEVYFEAIAYALNQGRQVLILLPEIALTQQFLDRFYARFGVAPIDWHSDLTPRRRERIWQQVAKGRIQVIAGARSALFLPFQNLGLIVVDEEHDAAYKQEGQVFYNARDMAVARGQIIGIPVILASATPSIESQVNAKQGRYRYIHLPLRFGCAAMPNIKTIDMRNNPPPAKHFLSPPMITAIREVLQRKEQSLLFLNRRGYAPLTLCRVCAHRFSCPNCSIWLVEHRHYSRLQCHHCGYHQSMPKVCPECGAIDHLVACGPGIERIAEEVSKKFSDARILVLSTDIEGGLKQLHSELEAVSRGHIDIVIGTQLITKGHNFPRVTLVGVIDADLGLANGDPRAAERTFQLLSQVTGRAGRTGLKSRGLIQTWQPDHPVMKAIVTNNSTAFYAREIEEREPNRLPPFGRLAALIVSGKAREEVENYARALRRAAPRGSDINVFGPAEAPLSLVRGRYRFRLLLHGDRRVNMQAFIRSLLAAAPATRRSICLQIDIDPQSFL
ncbi:MAG: primosomal protein N' (replication factor Y) (superfamily II helicase) [Candidatus Tokpelaia sp. JSC188]|nr:MAG: primosomal protein N' (replication factor Y) (superfamily II helicase) [Candidatus Tokpelaia sp. JSC188]